LESFEVGKSYLPLSTSKRRYVVHTICKLAALAAIATTLFGCAGISGGSGSLVGTWTGEYGFTPKTKFTATVVHGNRFEARLSNGVDIQGSLKDGKVNFDTIVDEPYQIREGGNVVATRGVFTMWRYRP
jgi:hypothetical protein